MNYHKYLASKSPIYIWCTWKLRGCNWAFNISYSNVNASLWSAERESGLDLALGVSLSANKSLKSWNASGDILKFCLKWLGLFIKSWNLNIIKYYQPTTVKQ